MDPYTEGKVKQTVRENWLYFSELKILRPPSNFFKYEDQKLC